MTDEEWVAWLPTVGAANVDLGRAALGRLTSALDLISDYGMPGMSVARFRLGEAAYVIRTWRDGEPRYPYKIVPAESVAELVWSACVQVSLAAARNDPLERVWALTLAEWLVRAAVGRVDEQAAAEKAYAERLRIEQEADKLMKRSGGVYHRR